MLHTTHYALECTGDGGDRDKPCTGTSCAGRGAGRESMRPGEDGVFTDELFSDGLARWFAVIVADWLIYYFACGLLGWLVNVSANWQVESLVDWLGG